ncbi:MAG: endonuclease/exonuclease/phosphatase family protein [Bacteroidia bacterium]|nr:endonuclease/exonuclease/phosphatase family protein [Bacteroidia bacterium]
MNRGNKVTWFDRIAWFLNIACVVGILLSYLAEYISPETVWWLALFGLGYGPLVLLNVLFIIYWIIRRRKLFLISLIAVLAGSGKILSLYQISFKGPAPENSGALKVMSFNVRLFDLYNWFHNHETRKNILEFLDHQQPDILCIQEFYSSDRQEEQFKNDDTLKTLLSASAHIEYSLTLRKTDHWGIATFSRFPIIYQGVVSFKEHGGNSFIYTDIVRNKDTIRIFNTHLESVRLGWADYRFFENLGNDEIRQDEVAGGKQILKRLKIAFIKRAYQARLLRDTIKQSPYPVILCGDFNDTPSSYTYGILTGELKDSFRESGNGSGKSYAGPFPSFRIDYIFHDNHFTSYDFTTYREKLSDHYPVSCELVLKR